jgi:hypothetical protein
LYNNQVKGSAEEMTVAVKMTAMDTATATVKATKKKQNQCQPRRGCIKDSNKDSKPGMYLEARCLYLALAFSVGGNDGEKK